MPQGSASSSRSLPTSEVREDGREDLVDRRRVGGVVRRTSGGRGDAAQRGQVGVLAVADLRADLPRAADRLAAEGRKRQVALAVEARRALAAQKVINLARGSATASSFSGMKAMLKSIGVLASARVRLPLRTVSAEEEARIAAATAEFGLRGLD